MLARSAIRPKILGNRVSSTAGRSIGTKMARAVGVKSHMSSVWDNFTMTENSFKYLVYPLPTTTAASVDECAGFCNEEYKCEAYAWCPTTQETAGCETPFEDLTPQEPLPAGTCLLSYDPVPSRAAYYSMYGDSVAWVSGSFAPGSNNGTTPPSPPESVDVIPVPPGGQIGTSWNAGDGTTTCGTFQDGQWADGTEEWVTSTAVPPDVDRTAVEALVAELCINPTAASAGVTLAEALYLAGGTDAQVAFLASITECSTSGDPVIQPFIDFVNPEENTNVASVLSYAQAWVEAGDSLGYGTCVSVVVLDQQGSSVGLYTVHPPSNAAS